MAEVSKTRNGTIIAKRGFEVEKSNNATSKGTRIVKKGNELDKNAFLKILTAELTNQDPTNAKDSTAYISQFAQFASLEQMANLNGTMSFNSASSLVGKTVALSAYDDWGHQYGGRVTNVTKQGDNIKLMVNVPKYRGEKIIDYEDKEFDYKDLSDVLNVPADDTVLLQYLKDHFAYLNNNMNFMSATSIVNKKVQLTTYEENKDAKEGEDKYKEVKYSGTVKEVYKTKEGVKVNVILDETGKEKEFLFDDVSKILS
ncbi:flagellar hook capping FlgD N-terminal domain-containing protein [Clostridium brassicae]|uniref:Basal-body rod modification protein FlgD n=1 Tax=Clostridium brassicae TaxID=2999072 RepID=A0ABT4DBB6_9CLOT|nr:flagellar hook capping FlgD N-terminal domain-containing protein [Clostridium brassicae]MCY6959604.1 flagellar biosynthesis protein FlgD [Clostridium brassicae]